LTGKGTSLSTEGKKCGLDIAVLERFEAERPVVPCGPIHKQKCKLVTANRNAVAESNIEMNNV
jgi:hypothetical protein